MDNIEDYLRTLHPKTWDNDLNQLQKIIQVLATYSTFYGAYHIGVNEITR